jgi:hypothetical protein
MAWFLLMFLLGEQVGRGNAAARDRALEISCYGIGDRQNSSIAKPTLFKPMLPAFARARMRYSEVRNSGTGATDDFKLKGTHKSKRNDEG